MVTERRYKNAADLIADRYGVRTVSLDNPEISTIGLTAARVFKNNPRRLALVVINLSANAMYLALTLDVAATKGIYLAPNGGSVNMTLDDDFELVEREWWIIAAGAASSLYSLSVEIYG